MRVLFLVLFVLSCKESPEKTPAKQPEATPTADETSADEKAQLPTQEPAGDADAVAVAKAAAARLGAALKARLTVAMSEGGPEAGLEACSAEAISITKAASSPGIRVGRSSLRLRNPENAGAPQWVRDWLKAQGERPREGLAPVAELVEGTGRFLMPIGVEAPCVLCHGAVGELSPGVRSLLQEHYPEDAATGYKVGDLRGALWAEASSVRPK